MAYSYTLFTGNGSTTQYAVAFGYIRREHVLATVAGSPATFTWVNNSLIQMDTAPANGAAVRVYRVTPLSAPLVDFADGATLVAADLDTNARQSIYTQQELDDELVDGLAGVIPNGDKGDITTSVGGTVWTIDAGAVTSAKILDGTILNADINASAAIAATKLAFTPAGSVAATTVQAAVQELDTEKAPLASPALTGVPTAPTATAGTNTTQLATTAFTTGAVSTSDSAVRPIATGGTGAITAALALAALLPSQAGNAGKALVTNATTATWGTVAAGASIQVFTASGTYTPTAGKATFLVFATGSGGGGGGGGGGSVGPGSGYAGGSGSSGLGGGTGFRLYTSAEMGSTAAITVGGLGSGGGGGSAGGFFSGSPGSNGGTGGSAQIVPTGTGLTLAGNGGGGGAGGGYGSSSGPTGGGVSGSAGGASNSYFSIPGNGRSTFWTTGPGYGGPGGGGGGNSSSSGTAGTAGTAGVVFILEW